MQQGSGPPEDAMTTRLPTRPMVIVGVDGSEDGRHALHWAAGEAGRRRLPLRVMHAVDFPDGPIGQRAGSAPDRMMGLDDAQRIVDDALADVARTWPDVTASADWIVGTPWAVLARAATESDLIVVGSRGRRRRRSVSMGSVSADVAQRATCPVVVVRATRGRSYFDARNGIVVGIDGSEGSMVATGFAFAAAAARRLPLSVVHAVWAPSPASPTSVVSLAAVNRATLDADTVDIAATIVGWRQRYPEVPVATRHENGRPARVLADLAAGADLLVVGARGHTTTADLLLGSVSRNALEIAPCAVAVVRGSGRREWTSVPAVAQPAG
jgi:nucleotide-binding universal stress UspA family protein